MYLRHECACTLRNASLLDRSLILEGSLLSKKKMKELVDNVLYLDSALAFGYLSMSIIQS